MSLPRYPAYKDSGVVWLGEVPDHWRLNRLGDICNFEQGKAHEPYIDLDGDYIYVSSRFVSTNGEAIKFCSKSLTLANKNDILMVMSDLPNGRALAKAYLVSDDRKYAVNQRVCRISVNESHHKFLFYLLNRHPDLLKNDDGANQTNLSNSNFLKLKLHLPSNQEQNIIAQFLDRETAKIDDLIAEQEKLITLLDEKLQAMISYAVTKGLNPDAPMKDSGVEWLGEVPEHWDVSKLGYLVSKIGSGKTPLGGSEVYSDQGVLFIRSQNVYDDGLRLDDVVFISEFINSQMKVSEVLGGDILLNITGASIGRTCIVPREFDRANVNQHVCIIRLKEQSKSVFIAHYCKSSLIKNQIDFTQNGAGREGLNFSQISNFSVPIPPHDEQQQIVCYLDKKSTQLNTLKAEAQLGIDLFKERRSALISAAVTGKIDVRNINI